MRRVSGGYTILEVSIVLAISLGIMAAAWNLIGGKQAETDFNQRMRDTQSKIQDWINDVSTGNTGADPQSQYCSIAVISGSRRPVIQTGSPTTPQCVFLGKAIQFTDSTSSGSDKLYTYSVFGCRAVGCPASPTASTAAPTTVADSSPKAADGYTTGLSLTETFNLSPVEVNSVCSDAACTTHNQIIGFYNSLNTQNARTSNGAEDINVYAFPLDSNQAKDSKQIDDCLKLLSPCNVGGSGNPPALSNYTICFTDGSRYAEITITSAAGIGASTDLVYKSC